VISTRLEILFMTVIDTAVIAAVLRQLPGKTSPIVEADIYKNMNCARQVT
jgi:hypothetical protein